MMGGEETLEEDPETYKNIWQRDNWKIGKLDLELKSRSLKVPRNLILALSAFVVLKFEKSDFSRIIRPGALRSKKSSPNSRACHGRDELVMDVAEHEIASEQSRGLAELIGSSSYEVDDASHAIARLNHHLISVVLACSLASLSP
jgi:hypothetical protein